MADATSDIIRDDERVRVTRWSFAGPGESTGVHLHEFDYIVIPVTGGRLTVELQDGTTTGMLQRAGEPYSGVAGTRHNVVCGSRDPIVFVEVELKR